jgi:hypothetical protein
MMVFRQRQRFTEYLDKLQRRASDLFPDRYIQVSQFRAKFGRDPNLETPATFNEKIHWLMLHYRLPEMTRLADKYEVRTHVAARVGDWLLNELYGVWEDWSTLDFNRLPDSFVLKVTSGSGQNIICRDKSLLDFERARRQLREWMKQNEYRVGREWAYKDIRPRVICEKFLTDDEGHIPCDYKLFCFHGEPRFVQVDTDRFTNHRRDLFDLEWKLLPFQYSYPATDAPISKPRQLETMVSLARALSEGFPFVRVDFYSMGERVVFGEMTWYPEGGLGRFHPEEYDLEVGRALTLPGPVNASFTSRVWSKMARRTPTARSLRSS